MLHVIVSLTKYFFVIFLESEIVMLVGISSQILAMASDAIVRLSWNTWRIIVFICEIFWASEEILSLNMLSRVKDPEV